MGQLVIRDTHSWPRGGSQPFYRHFGQQNSTWEDRTCVHTVVFRRVWHTVQIKSIT